MLSLKRQQIHGLLKYMNNFISSKLAIQNRGVLIGLLEMLILVLFTTMNFLFIVSLCTSIE